MKNNIELKAIKKLKKYKQDRIIDLLENIEEKESLYKQILELDFNKIDKLYNELSKKEKISGDNIEEITALNKDKLSKEELEKYDTLGENIIKNNQYALVTMSGGQGTRLGYDKAKGTFKVNIDPEPKYLFEILADKLKSVNEKYNVIVKF